MVTLSEAKDLPSSLRKRKQSTVVITLQSLCMQAGRIPILFLIFTGLLPSQSAPQASKSAAAKEQVQAEQEPAATKLSVPIFRDIAAQAGLTASHISSADKHYVVESMSGGIGLFDCDNDGKLDIVTVNGSTVDRYRQGGGDPLVTLWHQDANLKFTDITQKAGLAWELPSLTSTMTAISTSS